MKMPKKISPDRIKQAVVEVKYRTDFLYEISLGMFYNALDETYFYTNRPITSQNNNKISIDVPADLMGALSNMAMSSFQTMGQSIFFNDKIKIQLQQNSIVFNCLHDEYISWETYEQEIEKALSQLLKANVIASFSGVGIRYVSHYPEIDLKNCVKFTFTFGMPEIISNSYSFRSEFNYENHIAFINLHNKMPIFDSKIQQGRLLSIPTSIIDIDVIAKDITIGIEDVKNIMECISNVHQKEKEIFFNLLKEEFLQTLNPVY